MSFRGFVVDALILLICFALIGYIFVWYRFGDTYPWANFNVGLTLLLIGVLFKRHQKVKGQIAIFILLVILTLRIISPVLEYTQEDNRVIGSSFSLMIGNIGFDLVIFLITVVYAFICKKVVSPYLGNIFRGSERERKEKEQREINFYYDKFIYCDNEELNSILNKAEQYPDNAQTALEKIRTEKGF